MHHIGFWLHRSMFNEPDNWDVVVVMGPVFLATLDRVFCTNFLPSHCEGNNLPVLLFFSYGSVTDLQ
jgi:hypothetical protein